MNIAYRWFLGYRISEAVPHIATVSFNFRHRFTTETIEDIFTWILTEVESSDYLSPEVVFLDDTHIKANANLHKKIKREIPKTAKIYEEQLREEINADRDDHDKKPFDDDPPNKTAETRVVTESTTDPESGVFHKGDHEKFFAYTAQTVCDKHNFVMDVTINPGNIHDSIAFDEIYKKVTQRFPKIEMIVADAGYKTLWMQGNI